jgi:lipopolysaccharide cholinephosphotransferase
MEEADSLAWAMEINEYKLLSKDVLFPLKRHEFEGEMFNIPCNYDTYLREYFGDYMQLPPLNKRVRHNNGIEPFTRCNHKESLEWNE